MKNLFSHLHIIYNIFGNPENRLTAAIIIGINSRPPWNNAHLYLKLTISSIDWTSKGYAQRIWRRSLTKQDDFVIFIFIYLGKAKVIKIKTKRNSQKVTIIWKNEPMKFREKVKICMEASTQPKSVKKNNGSLKRNIILCRKKKLNDEE